MRKKLNLTIYTNGTFEEEMALVQGNKVLEKGDYYHDHIKERIDGFISGLDYAGYIVNTKNKTVYPKDKIFNVIDFYNNLYGEECNN